MIAGDTLGHVAMYAYQKRVSDEVPARQAVADAVIAAHEARRWKPIESAPKDGAIILVHRHGCETPFLAAWLDGAAIRQPGWHHIDINKRFHSEPTHWTPLPAPPKEASDAE